MPKPPRQSLVIGAIAWRDGQELEAYRTVERGYVPGVRPPRSHGAQWRAVTGARVHETATPKLGVQADPSSCRGASVLINQRRRRAPHVMSVSAMPFQAAARSSCCVELSDTGRAAAVGSSAAAGRGAGPKSTCQRSTICATRLAPQQSTTLRIPVWTATAEPASL